MKDDWKVSKKIKKKVTVISGVGDADGQHLSL